MILNNELFDSIQDAAQASPRRRMHFDLRTGADDLSQRMLNVMMADTVIPIHRHNDTSETVIVCRGSVREEFYDDHGNLIDYFILTAGGDCPGIQIPKGVYHTCICLESGSVIFEAKDRPYDPERTEDKL